MSNNHFDLIIIGAGPGGYVCAIRAAQLGMKVACVDKRATLGGVCLNEGCIPSKALLDASERYEDMKDHAKDYGIECSKVSLNLKAMLARKDKVVADLCKGIEGLFKKNKVTSIIGEASFTSPQSIAVKDEKGAVTAYHATHFVIATGSSIMPLPGVTIDEKHIVSSTGALHLPDVPDTLVVIGGGYIGLEMGSVWRRLGAKVTVVEYADAIVPAMDKEIGKQLHKILEKQGIQFMLGTKVAAAEVKGKEVHLTIERAKGGKSETIKAAKVLVSIGRKAYTEGLGLEALGITCDARGRIPINSHWQTTIPNIYAIGDVVEGPMLAHKAEEEGVAVAEILAGQAGHVNADVIPSVIYTWPEVGSVGKTEEELKQAGIAYKAGKFPFMANSRARSVGTVEGMVKILACASTDKVLGVHIIGADAGTLIAEAAAVMEFGGAAEDIARTCHAHPTLNEAVKEAALAVDSRAIHI